MFADAFCRISTSVVHWLPKPRRRVRLPYPALHETPPGVFFRLAIPAPQARMPPKTVCKGQCLPKALRLRCYHGMARRDCSLDTMSGLFPGFPIQFDHCSTLAGLNSGFLIPFGHWCPLLGLLSGFLIPFGRRRSLSGLFSGYLIPYNRSFDRSAFERQFVRANAFRRHSVFRCYCASE